jgi:O-succinylbenzoate synthase
VATVKLEAVELRRVALPLVTPFRTSFGLQLDRDALLVRVITDTGDGWGECVAMAEPLYSSEYADGAQDVMRSHLIPRLFAAESLDAAAVKPLLSAVKGHPMAKAALEMAVLDAELRASGQSFGERLGATREAVDCGVSIGIFPTIKELIVQVDGYLDEGYKRIKLKIEPGWDYEPVRAVRERWPDIPLQVDANTAYSLAEEHVAALKALDEFDLLLVEQPLPEDDVSGHAVLAQQIATPVCLDESILSAESAADAIARGACSIVNIKAGRVGGYLEAVRVHEVCQAAGVAVWCGGMLETGLGRAANVALAALPGFTLPGDTSGSDRYFAPDITEPFVLEDGQLRVPKGPGLGVWPLADVLATTTRSVEMVRQEGGRSR